MKTPDKRVIILEDDKDIADLFAQLLTSYGAIPVICENQKDVLDAISEESIVLALLDIMLPETDGRDVAKMLKGMDVPFPVYFMTGIRESNIGEEYRAMADGVLQKPFSIKDLRSLLDSVLGCDKDNEQCDAKRKVLELMTTVASEQENLRRQEARLSGLLQEFEKRTGDYSMSEPFKEFNMGLQACISRISSRLDEIRAIIENSCSS